MTWAQSTNIRRIFRDVAVSTRRSIIVLRIFLGVSVAIVECVSFTAAALPQALLSEVRPQDPFTIMTPEERTLLLDQLSILFEQMYANRILKTERYGVDATAAISQLRKNEAGLRDADLHAAIAQIFNSQRDLHLTYSFPRPASCYASMLPFDVDFAWDENGFRRIFIKSIAQSALRFIIDRGYRQGIGPTAPGDTLIAINDKPIHQVLNALVPMGAGANTWGAEAQALDKLTLRIHRFDPLPTNDEVTLTIAHRKGGETRVQVPWVVVRDDACLVAPEIHPEEDFHPALEPMAINARWISTNTMRGLINRKDSTLAEPAKLTQTPGSLFKWGFLENEDGRFGWIRMATFSPDASRFNGDTQIAIDQSLRELRQILDSMHNTQGLIIDVRNNPGGYVSFVDRMIQLFAREPIEPFRDRWMISPVYGVLAHAPWNVANGVAKIYDRAVSQKALFTAPIVTTSTAEANKDGQYYFRNVAILTNARCYSSCDAFVAALQDHRAATVFGEDAWQTGGGGALVQSFDHTRRILNFIQRNSAITHPLKPLPLGIQVTYSATVGVRSGRNNLRTLEDEGVIADRLLHASLSDVLNKQTDYFRPLTTYLKHRNLWRPGSGAIFHRQLDPYVDLFDTDVTLRTKESIRLTVFNTDRVVVKLDKKPLQTLETKSKNYETITLSLPELIPGALHRIDLIGERGGLPDWRTVRKFRVLPAKAEKITPRDAFQIDFAQNQTAPLVISTQSRTQNNGWRIANGTLYTSSQNCSYSDNTLTAASLFADLSYMTRATLRLTATINTEPHSDLFWVEIVADGKRKILAEPFSGNITWDEKEFNLTPYAGKSIEIRLAFKSKSGSKLPGVAIHRLRIE